MIYHNKTFLYDFDINFKQMNIPNHKVKSSNEERVTIIFYLFVFFVVLLLLHTKQKKKYKLPLINIILKYNRDYGNLSTQTKIIIEKIYNGEFDNEKYEDDDTLDSIDAHYFGNYHFDVTKDYLKMFKFYLIAIRKNNTKSMLSLANYYDTVLKNNDEKIKYLLRAVTDHNDTDAIVHLMYHYLALKNYSKMFIYLSMLPSNNSDRLQCLGTYNYLKKKYDKCKKYYEMAIFLKNNLAMYNLGVCYLNEKKYDEGKKYFLMAIKENNSNAMYGLSIYYKKLKNYKKMNEYLLMAIKFNNLFAIEILKNHYQNNLLVYYILLDNEKNNIFIEEQKEKLLNDPKIKYYTKNKDKSKILEFCICFESKINIKLQCSHMICYECFYKINKCPFRCTKFI